jgi:short-subunit dehydrogenase
MVMKQEQKEQFGVVTGASQGLGKAFVHELARLKMNLILVSLPGQNLHLLANEIEQRYKVKARCYETNFSSNDNIINLSNWINNNFEIHLLINNAGIGGTRCFDDVHLEYIDTIIQVNVKATSLLTHQLLPNLQRQRKSYILNVSSIAAFSPVGYKTVYPASKAFIHSFSRGLYEELKNTNVFVSVMNPGAMATNEEITLRIKKQGFLGKITLLHPEKVARRAIKRLFKRDSVIMLNPLTWLVAAVLPVWIKLPLMTRIVKREVTYENNICYGN